MPWPAEAVLLEWGRRPAAGGAARLRRCHGWQLHKETEACSVAAPLPPPLPSIFAPHWNTRQEKLAAAAEAASAAKPTSLALYWRTRPSMGWHQSQQPFAGAPPGRPAQLYCYSALAAIVAGEASASIPPLPTAALVYCPHRSWGVEAAHAEVSEAAVPPYWRRIGQPRHVLANPAPPLPMRCRFDVQEVDGRRVAWGCRVALPGIPARSCARETGQS